MTYWCQKWCPIKNCFTVFNMISFGSHCGYLHIGVAWAKAQWDILWFCVNLSPIRRLAEMETRHIWSANWLHGWSSDS